MTEDARQPIYTVSYPAFVTHATSFLYVCRFVYGIHFWSKIGKLKDYAFFFSMTDVARFLYLGVTPFYICFSMIPPSILFSFLSFPVRWEESHYTDLV